MPPDDLAPLLQSKLVRKLDHPVKSISYASKEGVHCWVVACFVVMILSVLRGIRLPSSWTYSHYLINYDFGFTKRGVLGGIVEQVGIPYLASYEFFALFCASILLGNLLLLATLLRDLIRSGNILLLSCSMIFVCSPVLPFLAHIIGYGDHLGMFITLVVLKIRCFWQKLTFAAPSLAVALLAHEANFIFFSPVILISLLLNIKENRRTHQFTALIAVSIFWIGATYLISLPNLTREQTLAMYDTIQAGTEFPLHPDTFEVLHRDVGDNFAFLLGPDAFEVRHRDVGDSFDNAQRAWTDPRSIGRYVNSLLAILPVPAICNSLLAILPILAICLGTATFFLLRSDSNRYIIPLAISASLSPLTLHLIAKDTYRWSVWTSVTSFFILHIVSRRYQNQLPSKLVSISAPVLTIVVFITSISSLRLFDGYTMSWFPFISHQKYVFSLNTTKRQIIDRVLDNPNPKSMLDDPIITSDYNVYLKDDHLLYVRDECINTDVDFFVHIIPSDVDVLPEHRKVYGFESRNFRLVDFSQPSSLGCLLLRKLPKYDIAAISTGQYTAEGRLWESIYHFKNSLDSKAQNSGVLTNRSRQTGR